MTELEKSLEKLNRGIEQIGIALSEVFLDSMGLFQDAIHSFRTYLITTKSFERGEDESFLEWSERLNSQGYLDNPDYRWEYQKATFRWVASPLFWLWYKVKGDD